MFACMQQQKKKKKVIIYLFPIQITSLDTFLWQREEKTEETVLPVHIWNRLIKKKKKLW